MKKDINMTASFPGEIKRQICSVMYFILKNIITMAEVSIKVLIWWLSCSKPKVEKMKSVKHQHNLSNKGICDSNGFYQSSNVMIIWMTMCLKLYQKWRIKRELITFHNTWQWYFFFVFQRHTGWCLITGRESSNPIVTQVVVEPWPHVTFRVTSLNLRLVETGLET